MPNSEEQRPISAKPKLTKPKPKPPKERKPEKKTEKKPEKENDDDWMEPDYTNHFWIYMEMRKCQVCKRRLETPSKGEGIL